MIVNLLFAVLGALLAVVIVALCVAAAERRPPTDYSATDKERRP